MFSLSKTVFFLLAVTSSAAASTPQLKQPSSSSSSSAVHHKKNGAEEMEQLELSVELMSKFHSWVEFHDKEYDSHEEKMKRLQIWIENDERIEAHNNQEPKPTFTLGHNPYSDMTQDEFEQYFKLGQYSREPPRSAGAGGETFEAFERLAGAFQGSGMPFEVNWVGLGGVTDVKDQGFCGACWAFSTTGALEGAKFVKTGELVPLSEQNLLDCDHTDLGCSGGLMDNAFKFDEKTGGICSEDDYPYMAKQGTCMTNCTDVPGTIVKTFVDVPPGKVKALEAAVTLQPISVAIQANQFVFQFYKNGVITDDSCGSSANIDHGVLLVGMGTDEETQEPYFLVKNSWGAKWGDKGYVKMSRNSKNEFGMCAILKMASFPEVM